MQHQLVDQQLLAAAESASPESDPLGVTLHLDNERRGALAGLAAEAAVADAVDEAKVQAAYEKQVAEFKPQPEFSAAHILVDSEEKAKALGYEPLGYIRSYAYAALAPSAQLLQGPAYAAPMALDRAGVPR